MIGTTAKGAAFIKHISAIIANAKGFETLMSKVKMIDGGGGKCVAEFTVGPEHLNRMGFLHGGFTANIVDMITTYAVMGNPSSPGVSVDLHVSFMKPAKEGDEILINANTLRCGKKLAFIECELRHKKDGTLIAKGNQTKYVDVTG